MKLRSLLKYWLPVLVWMIFIFIGSGDLLSAEHTSRFIGPFLRWFAPGITDATVASIQFIVRKCAHLTEYGVLATLLLRAFRQLPLTRVFGITFVVAAVFAALDEFHQSFVASRTGSPWDVIIDCIGALAGLVLYGFMIRRKRSTFKIRYSTFDIRH